MSTESDFRKNECAGQEEFHVETPRRFDWLGFIIWAVIIFGVFFGIVKLAKADDSVGEARLLAYFIGCTTAEEAKGFLDVLGKSGPETKEMPKVKGCGVHGPDPMAKAYFGGLPVTTYDGEQYENEWLTTTILVIDVFGDKSKRYYSWRGLEWKSRNDGQKA